MAGAGRLSVLPLRPPVAPVLARPAGTIPPGMQYEPKWDGWRCLLWRDEQTARLWSRRGTDLTGPFPDLVTAALHELPSGCVLDGEVVVAQDGVLRYTLLAERNATGRTARAVPATFVAFDLLVLDGQDLTGRPLAERRAALERLLADAAWPFLLSPATVDVELAQRWFHDYEAAGLDGVVAKPLHDRYRFGERAWLKIKHVRTADVVVAGYRLDRSSTPSRPSLGSLQLGLMDDDGALQFVGVCSGFAADSRHELAQLLATLTVPAHDLRDSGHAWAPRSVARTHARVPEGIDRSSTRHGDRVRLIDPCLVAEVSYDHLYDATRFRSNAAFVRWRPDRDPASCTFAQLPDADGLDLDRLSPDR